MLQRLLRRRSRALGPVEDEGSEEKDHKRQTQGTGIDGPREGAPAQGRGRSRLVGLGLKIGVARRRLGVPGFRRTLLDQEGGQDHIGRHLQELALPVLEDGRQEWSAAEVFHQRAAVLAVTQGVRRLDPPPCYGVADNAGGEEEQKKKRQAVVAQDPHNVLRVPL
ncbi:hypothetical protein D3C72_829990 [compost metagenome]